LHDFYVPDAYFKDPFNEVRDVASITHIFAEMYVSLHDPQFVIHSNVAQGDEAFLTRDFCFRIKKIQSSRHAKYSRQLAP